MEILFTNILAYIVSLAVNEHSASIHKKREAKLEKTLANERLLTRAIRSKKSLQEEIVIACIQLAQDKNKLGIQGAEARLWDLLSDREFQEIFYHWVMAGALPEGDPIRTKMLGKIKTALQEQGLSAERLSFLETNFLQQIDKAVFSNDLLANWRHQLSLDYLRNQVTTLLCKADEAAGIYSESQKKLALDKYCEEAFKAWDIIDLTNLPEGDVDIATQNLLVRQLYMPLRISLEDDRQALGEIEELRNKRRLQEAGHVPRENDHSPVAKAGLGHWLGMHQRLVVLGDPGGGKTTMLRWLATAMLLRYRSDAAFSQLPDVETLPTRTWIPVLIRCRDLGETDLCRGFPEFLTQHLLKSTLLPLEARIMHSLILEKIANNEVLLMVDGLDEITNSQVRVNFCQELERTAARYPSASIIVTSRIVGYRDMPYRMGKGFKHGIISELDRAHKDLFARRWIEVTEQRQSPEERIRRQRELIIALHASDRIERLTGNPMLLTTLALVKRKVGKLPSRRNKLYAEAVAVLLNWNPGFYAPIDDSEAIPQLEYLAFEMCKRGVQRLTDNEIMELLEQFRRDYPAVRAVRKHTESEFLELLEARSSILIKSGSVWKKSGIREQAVWEFRHLTFQEYLAAQALLDGRYPGRDKTLSLALHVAPLAGMVRESGQVGLRRNHLEVPESWREALRLLVADCKDDDVDDVLRAILQPLSSEDRSVTQRTRAILAGLCLADEPNTSEAVAQEIFDELMKQVERDDAHGPEQTPLRGSLAELFHSQWGRNLTNILVAGYCSSQEDMSGTYGSLLGDIAARNWITLGVPDAQRDATLISQLSSPEPELAITSALTVMNLAYNGKIDAKPELISTLFQMLDRSPGEQSAAIWALGWLGTGTRNSETAAWRISARQAQVLGSQLQKIPVANIDSQFWTIRILARTSVKLAIPAIMPFLTAPHERPQYAAIAAFAKFNTAGARDALSRLLSQQNKKAALFAAQKLAQLGDVRGRSRICEAWKNEELPDAELASAVLASEDSSSKLLLSQDFDSYSPLLPRGTTIDTQRIQEAMVHSGLDEESVRALYHRLAAEYGYSMA